MKKQKSTKYKYWKWVILNKLNSLHENEILIYDQQQNSISTYGIKEKQVLSIDYDFIFDAIFKLKMLKLILSNDEIDKFYKNLPKEYKEIFWASME